MAADTPLGDRIKHALEELRVVVPGTQALLGFQFIAVFSEGFTKLPQWSKDVHFVALLSVTLSGLLLMMPAAFHRIVYEGNDTEEVHSFASRTCIAAMAVLAMGICLDLLVVGRVILGQDLLPGIIAICAGGLFVIGWFAYPLYRRHFRG